MKTDSYPFNYVRILNHKIFNSINKVSSLEDELKRIIIIFKTTINSLKSSNLNLSSFYFNNNNSYLNIEYEIKNN